MKIENITVQLADKHKLIKLLNIDLKENETLVIHKFAIYSDLFAIDTDCCFWQILDKHNNGKIEKCINIECRIETFTKDGSYIRMDKPDFIKTITLESYLDIANDIQLIDFIRYNYNPRIVSNQKLLMAYIKAEQT